MRTPSWLKIALNEKRVFEIKGQEHNPHILEYHAVTTLRATSDEVSWCSAFVCWCMEKAGIPSTKSAAARSWLNWGIPIDQPLPGCVVVLSRGNNPAEGHVGFWLSEDDDNVFVFGGNQSDMTCVDAYEKSRVLGYRMPDEKYWKGLTE